MASLDADHKPRRPTRHSQPRLSQVVCMNTQTKFGNAWQHCLHIQHEKEREIGKVSMGGILGSDPASSNYKSLLIENSKSKRKF